MEIRLLGPLEALDAGTPLALGGTKQRALLAALTLAGGRVLGAGRIVEDLWGPRPPDTAPKMVQIHVSALRKVLPPDVIVTRPPGYAVDLPREAVDVFRAEDALRAGRQALAAGDARGAAEVLGAALALWRGPALAEFAEPFADGEARRIEELRLALTEERLAADLALGAHADVVREVERLIAEHPLRERLRELAMVALYRSGRQAEALAAYQDARRVLSDELGIEPSARLRDLERAVLRQDASLDPPVPSPAPPAGRPAPGAAPIGRDAELAELGEALAAAAGGAGRVVLVTGEAGAGKTTLVDAFLDGLADGHAIVGRGQCVDQHGPSEAYMPVLQAIERICRAPGGGEALALLVERAPTWAVQVPWLLAPAQREALEARLVGANRDRMLREGVEALTDLARERAVVVAIEDLQSRPSPATGPRPGSWCWRRCARRTPWRAATRSRRRPPTSWRAGWRPRSPSGPSTRPRWAATSRPGCPARTSRRASRRRSRPAPAAAPCSWRRRSTGGSTTGARCGRTGGGG
jgi:DNA-binding SARP family transcriptional activator